MSNANPMTPASIKVYGAGDLRRIVQHQFDGHLGSGIENFGEQFYKIHKDSITLGDQATLFEAYLLSELGKIELDPGVKEIVYGMFETIGDQFVQDQPTRYRRIQI